MLHLLDGRIEKVLRNGYVDYDAYDKHGRFLGSYTTRADADQAIIDSHQR